MNMLAAPRPARTQPAPNPTDPNRPWPTQPSGPSFAMGQPDTESVPTPLPPPRPRLALRIGHAPRLPRRVRLARALRQGGRYLLAYAFVGWSCWWMGDVHMLLPGLAIAALVANPWRPKKSRRRVVDAVLAARRGSVAGATHSPRRSRAARAGQPSGLFPRTT